MTTTARFADPLEREALRRIVQRRDDGSPDAIIGNEPAVTNVPSRGAVEQWAGTAADYRDADVYDRIVNAVLESGTEDRAVWAAVRYGVVQALQGP